MNYVDTFKTFRKIGIKEDIVLLYSLLMYANISKKVKVRHLKNNNTFRKELIEAFDKNMWEESEEDVQKAIALWEAMIEYCDLGLDQSIPYEERLKNYLHAKQILS